MQQHRNHIKQDRQALLKAKYCPWVVAVSGMEKKHKKPRDLELTDALEIVIVEVHVHAKFHQAKCSGS